MLSLCKLCSRMETQGEMGVHSDTERDGCTLRHRERDGCTLRHRERETSVHSDTERQVYTHTYKQRERQVFPHTDGYASKAEDIPSMSCEQIATGSKAVANHIKQCITCRRARRPTEKQKMADLPANHVDPSPPFSYCGMDCLDHFTQSKVETRISVTLL